MLSSGEDNSLSAKPQNIPSTYKQPHTACAHTVGHNCCLRARSLCHSALLIYQALQVPWRRCRVLQFMSNLVNILSPVRPVSHCFSSHPHILLNFLRLQSRGDREKSSLDLNSIQHILSDSRPFCCLRACVEVCESLTSEPRHTDEAR